MALWMTNDFPIKEISLRFIAKTVENIFRPLRYLNLPIKWCAEAHEEHTKTAKRILIGVAISIPCLFVLLVLLSSADQIFRSSLAACLSDISRVINFNLLFKIACGFVVGFYLFGLLYSVYQPKAEKVYAAKTKDGDLIVLNILLASILAVYTLFVIIQFKYLFAAGYNLPYGLNYIEYARRGFFELLFLSGLNILLILVTTWLTKSKVGIWAKITKALCCYLCAITIILLISSFYRMWLYNYFDGLTRLRFLVFGFIIFEAIGLVITFFYIIKPKFNIAAVYLVIGLTYYLILNIAPMDAIIAKSQIDRYFATGKAGIEYTLTLSADAAPQIARLLESNYYDSYNAASGAKNNYFFGNHYKYYREVEPRWQRWNLSVSRLEKLWQQIE